MINDQNRSKIRKRKYRSKLKNSDSEVHHNCCRVFKKIEICSRHTNFSSRSRLWCSKRILIASFAKNRKKFKIVHFRPADHPSKKTFLVMKIIQHRYFWAPIKKQTKKKRANRPFPITSWGQKFDSTLFLTKNDQFWFFPKSGKKQLKNLVRVALG